MKNPSLLGKIKLHQLFIILIGLLIVSQFSCKKDEESLSFVDDYNPNLTEEKGVSYEGDFYPLGIGYSWKWDGTATVSATSGGKHRPGN